jgi:lipid II:glycine glycyltransferase (peptidoglycan interpeptide bridge formation enzyme)
MVRLVTRSFSQKEWTDIVSGFRDLSLIQTWEYGEAKVQTSRWKVERAIFMDGDRVIGAVQARVRRVPLLNAGLVWINRGPLWHRSEGDDSSLLVAMMEELRRYWVEQRHMYLRIAPAVMESEINVNGFEAAGYRVAGGAAGWASARVDLSHPTETLRSQLHQKWRNCLNKAERLGLTIESGPDGSAFHELIASYEALLKDREFQTNITPWFLAQLQALLPPESKLIAFVARLEGSPVGGALIARYGETCEYLVGTSNEESRAVNAGQFVLWQAACEMKSLGYRWLDLGGMDPERTPPGIFHFKAGVSGAPYRLFGEFETNGGGWFSKAVRWRVSRARQSVGV